MEISIAKIVAGKAQTARGAVLIERLNSHLSQESKATKSHEQNESNAGTQRTEREEGDFKPRNTGARKERNGEGQENLAQSTLRAQRARRKKSKF
jgi:hypothetical protein